MSVDVAGCFEAVRAAIEHAVSQAQAAMSEAYELRQEAAAHGWGGAALAVQAAYDQLESAVSSLHSAVDAADRAVAGVAGVREVANADELAATFASVVNQADDIRAALDATAEAAKVAYTWS